MDNCPDDSDIACYFDGILPEDKVGQLEEHFVECERCKEVMAITKKIISQEPNFIDNNRCSGNMKTIIRFVPCLKGEVPDVKKVKPSL